ncbi:MAG: diphthine--ammonia ligase [Candidatus Aenigmarchaeota archaeon]|nr:diphthine--ammonia ligase [Candidatus Aenigmarchaeota archaeon]
MKVVSLFSGGKDSTFSTYLAVMMGYEIKYLLTFFPKSTDSWMFHHPCIELTKVQARLMKKPQLIVKTSGKKEEELRDLKNGLLRIKDKLDGLVYGAVASEYQRHRINIVAEEVGLRSFSPLWHKNPQKLVKEILDAGFRVIITSVSCDGLNEEWLGKELTDESIKELVELSKKFGFNPAGEGGEFETFVLSSPLFDREIKITDYKKVWDDKTSSGYIIVKSYKVV